MRMVYSHDTGMRVNPLEAGHHAIFYSICQAVLYIFCYRQDSFVSLFETAPEVSANYHILLQCIVPLQ